MNDEINQLERLLEIANDKDLGDSFRFYNEMLRDLVVNIQLVDGMQFKSIDTYICEMSDDKYAQHQEEMQMLKIAGLRTSDFSIRKMFSL